MCKYNEVVGSQSFHCERRETKQREREREDVESIKWSPRCPRAKHLRTCEYDTLHGKRDLVEVVKDTDPGCRHPVLSGWAQSNHVSPSREKY